MATLASADDPEIRVIHFIPSDIEDVKENKFLHDIIKSVQIYYRDQLEFHGYQPKTFKTELNEQSDIKILKVEGLYPLDFYQMTWIRSNPANDNSNENLKIHSLILKELFDKKITNHDHLGSIYIIFLAGANNIVYRPEKPASGVSWTDGQNYANIVPVNTQSIEIVIAHEMGHSLGLRHNVETGYLMNSFQSVRWTLSELSISPKESEIISKSRYMHYTIKDNDVLDTDINFDGYIDHHDVKEVRKGIKDKSGYNTDVNGDGITDEEDLLIVKAKAFEFLAAASPRQIKTKIATWGSIKSKQ